MSTPAESSSGSGPPDTAERSAAVENVALELRDVTQVFERQSTGDFFTAVEGLNLKIPAGQFVSVVGPSGCGKSTLLNMASGSARPADGQVFIYGEPVTSIQHDVGFIFQRDAVLPWRTALDNVALPLRFRGVGKRDAKACAREWLVRVGLRGFEDHYPHQLSGGMRKRVSIAATLVYEPKLLLMDEPFSALDVQTRNLMENELLALWDQAGDQTVLFITHDLDEAIGLSDRVVVLSASPGRVIGDYEVPIARPRDLLEVSVADGYAELHELIWGHLRDEVIAAYQGSLEVGTTNGIANG